MTLKDVDLRDALAPLAGDPVDDAARVLRAMPNPGIPPVAWWLLGVGLAAGILLGVWFGADDPTEPRDRVEAVDDKAPVDKSPDQPSKNEEPWPEMDHIMFYGLGQVKVTEPGKASVDLTGGWKLDLATRFETGNAIAGMLLEGDVQVRLDRWTTAVLAGENKVRRLLLDEGRLYVVSGYEQTTPVVVTTPLGFVDVVNGRAMVDHRNARLQVTCLEGEVTMHSKSGGSTPVPAGAITWIGANGEGEQPTPAEFMARHTSWMTRLIVRQEDRRECDNRIREMVEEYFGGRFQREAARELLKLGSCAVGPLVEATASQADRPVRFQRNTAHLICDMASPDTALQLFRLLHARDPEVRVIIYERLVRLTDDGHDYGDRFWRRQDNLEARNKAIQEWWDRSQ